MSRLSVNEMTTYRWSFEEDVEHYRRAGMGAIGVWRQKLSDYGEERGAELLAESGLAVSNLLWAGGFTGNEGHSFEDSVADAIDAVRLCRAVGSDCLVVYTGARAGHTHNHARRIIDDALKAILPVAEEHEVTLAFEPMHPHYAAGWTYWTDFYAALDRVANQDHRLLRLVFDTYHFGTLPGIAARIREIAPWVAVVHLGDGRYSKGPDQDRTRLGDGEVPLRDLVHAFEAAGYSGYYDLELMGQDIEACCYHKLLDHSKRVFEQITSTAEV
ncbi:MAG: sugar phosphate isomerase/epimerase [Pirellulales bacterium]|nr:sugar phosphate isomerase/epimerase [Pirellulales bacterium]